MARYLKNPDIVKNGKLAARLPIVPSSAYGDSPVNGLIRFNQSTSKVEFYYNSVWNQVAKIGAVQLVVDDLVSANGTDTTFTMSQAETDPTAIIVTIGGVYQQPGTHYTVSGTAITFTSPPPLPSLPASPNRITIIHNINSTDAA
jgi:hypothetical protein